MFVVLDFFALGPNAFCPGGYRFWLRLLVSSVLDPLEDLLVLFGRLRLC